MLIAGDPGADGAYAFFQQGKLQLILRAETHPKDFISYVQKKRNPDEPIIAYLEQVHGVEGQSAQDTFTFGQHTGRMMAMMELVSDEYVRRISPQKWMPILQIPMGLERTVRKKMICERMRLLYPRAAIYLWNADAIAIGEAILQGSFEK